MNIFDWAQMRGINPKELERVLLEALITIAETKATDISFYGVEWTLLTGSGGGHSVTVKAIDAPAQAEPSLH